MGPAEIIVIALIVLIVGGASFYIIRAKKRGDHCIGCPYSKQCGGKCNCDSKNANGKDK
ncbi:MAG: FeoB-associated Cys-rich membrane protein [Clostridia bacterium]|nr:FeoB-associated Cys-rich membrane protein [Clostridia bacterium]